MRIRWANEDLHLFPQRAIWWPRAEAIIVTDLHLGKAASFRALGVPVPDGGAVADLARLSLPIDIAGAKTLLILGDLLHARTARSEPTLNALADWRARHPDLRVLVVRGNHDLHAGDPPESLGFECVSPPTRSDALELPESALCFDHAPPESAPGDDCLAPDAIEPQLHTLCGHIHPCVSLEPASGFGPGMRVPCFWFSPTVAVLPAFGSFTGAARVRPRAGDRVFAIGPSQVVEVPGVLAVR